MAGQPKTRARRESLEWREREVKIEQIKRGFLRLFDKVKPDDVDVIIYQALKRFKPAFLKKTNIVIEDTIPNEQLQDLEAEILRLKEMAGESEEVASANENELQQLIRQSIIRGLEKDNAQMVGKALEYVQELEAKEFLSNLTVEIVPYTIKDTSLEEIILRAPEEIVAKCEAAIRRRRIEGRTDPDLALRWETEYEDQTAMHGGTAPVSTGHALRR